MREFGRPGPDCLDKAGTRSVYISITVRVVVISSSPAERGALEMLLRDEGYDVTSASTRDEGLALARSSRPDAIIADTQLPGIDGLALVRDLAQRDLRAMTILLCARCTSPELVKLGVICMTKPIDVSTLCNHLARGMPRARVA